MKTHLQKSKSIPGLRVLVILTIYLFACAAFTSTNAFSQACDAPVLDMAPVSAITCTGTLYDGGGFDGNYSNSSNITFYIKPSGATSVSMTFFAFDLENGYDYVRIYNGYGTSSLIGSYTGSTLPPTATASTGTMTVVFTSDGTVTRSGWKATWNTIGGECGNAHNMPSTGFTSACSGTLYDQGGPGGNYSNNSTRSFTIFPTNAASICIAFSEWNVESNYDFLKIYDGSNASAPSLGTYSGEIPGNVTATSGAMHLVFTSDAIVTGTGWKANWSCESGKRTAPVSADRDFIISPNPSNGQVKMLFPEDMLNADLTVYSGDGKLILSQKVNATSVDLDLYNVSNGLYLTKIVTSNGETLNKRMVIEK